MVRRLMKWFGKAGIEPSKARDSEILLDGRDVLVAGERRRVEPRAASVLETLSGAEGAVVSRSSLLDLCWADETGSDEALTQAVAQLRRALGDDPRRPRYIETVPKRGYRWLGGPLAESRPARRPVRPGVTAAPLAAALVMALALGALGATAALLSVRTEREIVTYEVIKEFGQRE